MTVTISAPVRELLTLATSGSPFFWLLQFTSPLDGGLVDRDGSSRVPRLTSNGVAVSFDTNPSTGAALIWQSWPIEVDAIPARGDGSIDGVRLGLGNVDGYAARLYQENDRLRDHIVRLRLVHADLLADPTHGYLVRMRVTRSECGIDAVLVECASHNFAGVGFPPDIISDQCGWVYRSAECGFVLPTYDPQNTLGKRCPQSRSACRARGQWAVDEGLFASVEDSPWPYRFGGFPALPVDATGF